MSTNIDHYHTIILLKQVMQKASTKKALLSSFGFAADRKAAISQVFGDEVGPRKLQHKFHSSNICTSRRSNIQSSTKTELDKLDNVWKMLVWMMPKIHK